MSDSTKVEPAHRISRRTVVKGGLVAGGALWAAPAVQVLTATKASASTASGTTTTGGISYVMLVLKAAEGVFITAKVDQDGSLTCPGSASADQGSRWDTYLTNWSITSAASCPDDLKVLSHTATSVTIDLGTSELAGFMVHDGSLDKTKGKVGFASWTAKPANSNYLPDTWGAPGQNATGTVTFSEPA